MLSVLRLLAYLSKRHAICSEVLHQAEGHDLDDVVLQPALAQAQIARLDVAVHEAACMGLGQGGAGLGQDVDDARRG